MNSQQPAAPPREPAPVRRQDRRARRHQDTRSEILSAAWENVRKRGVAALSLREVADEVGMRPPSLYVYFPGKAAIYDAMFDQAAREFLTVVLQSGPSGAPRATLLAAARMFFDFCTADIARYQLLFERPVPGFRPSPESYSSAVRALEEASAFLAGVGADTPDAVDLWTALITGLVSQQLSNDPGGDRWRQLLGDAVDMFLAHVTRQYPQAGEEDGTDPVLR
ncbi:TetR/AcrR family transcriptional regulator [Arthrobacter sp. 2MCAF14]|uniref:TetR/AcrR family transcriptional regulator n=1 Tax=Arthrobacter sp. 2MCAF14 TaxID=3232982 RepID=UPI003F92D003